ncbi:hypothetical protein DIPPA_14117 [Diplonema papillatum]|nr:hypothetical protein DIPPA_14117 [Diplonema papillatum]
MLSRLVMVFVLLLATGCEAGWSSFGSYNWPYATSKTRRSSSKSNSYSKSNYNSKSNSNGKSNSNSKSNYNSKSNSNSKSNTPPATPPYGSPNTPPPSHGNKPRHWPGSKWGWGHGVFKWNYADLKERICGDDTASPSVYPTQTAAPLTAAPSAYPTRTVAPATSSPQTGAPTGAPGSGAGGSTAAPFTQAPPDEPTGTGYPDVMCMPGLFPGCGVCWASADNACADDEFCPAERPYAGCENCFDSPLVAAACGCFGVRRFKGCFACFFDAEEAAACAGPFPGTIIES